MSSVASELAWGARGSSFKINPIPGLQILLCPYRLLQFAAWRGAEGLVFAFRLHGRPLPYSVQSLRLRMTVGLVARSIMSNLVLNSLS